MGWTFFYFAIAKRAPPVKSFFSSSSFGKESQLSLLSLPSSVHKPTGGHGFLDYISLLFARFGLLSVRSFSLAVDAEEYGEQDGESPE